MTIPCLARCAIVIALIAVAAPAAAETFVLAPNGRFTLDLDTEEGNYSAWRMDGISSINAIRASASMLREGQHEQWLPSFSIIIYAGDARAQLAMGTERKAGPLHARTFYWNGGDRRDQSQVSQFAMTPQFQEAFDIAVTWTPEGTVSFTVYSQAAKVSGGFERHEVRLSVPPTAIEVVGSTAQVRFEPIELGQMIP